jgi:hypothetical protein
LDFSLLGCTTLYMAAAAAAEQAVCIWAYFFFYPTKPLTDRSMVS